MPDITHIALVLPGSGDTKFKGGITFNLKKHPAPKPMGKSFFLALRYPMMTYVTCLVRSCMVAISQMTGTGDSAEPT